MRSLRLDEELDDRVRRAAALKGESVSEFLRSAASARADEVLASNTRARFADVSGVVHGGGGRAERTGDAFRELLGERAAKR
jgi:hypothetical protein